MWKWRETCIGLYMSGEQAVPAGGQWIFFDKGCIVPRFHQSIQHSKWPDIKLCKDEFIPQLNFQPLTSSKINLGKEKSSFSLRLQAGLFLSLVDLRASLRLKIQLQDKFILTSSNIWSLFMLYCLMEPGNNTPLVKKIHWPPAGTACSPDMYNPIHVLPPFPHDMYNPILVTSW